MDIYNNVYGIDLNTKEDYEYVRDEICYAYAEVSYQIEKLQRRLEKLKERKDKLQNEAFAAKAIADENGWRR